MWTTSPPCRNAPAPPYPQKDYFSSAWSTDTIQLLYSVAKSQIGGIEVVRLADAARGMEVSLAPSVGNIAYQFAVHGKNVLWFPFGGPDELRAAPKTCGIPFLAPWANRIDGDAYWVNGKPYALNSALGNLRRDPNQRPIHGLLLFSPLWELIAA